MPIITHFPSKSYEKIPGRTGENRLVLQFFVGDIDHNVFDPTMQDLAEDFNGVGTDTFIPFQTGDLPRTDLVLLDQSILGNAPLFHNIPEVFV